MSVGMAAGSGEEGERALRREMSASSVEVLKCGIGVPGSILTNYSDQSTNKT
jgi:hypothetical protein